MSMKQALLTGSATALPAHSVAPLPGPGYCSSSTWPLLPANVTQPPSCPTVTTGTPFIRPGSVARTEGQQIEAVQAPCTPQVSVNLGGLSPSPTLPAGQAQQGCSTGGAPASGSFSFGCSNTTSGLLLLAGVAELCEERGLSVAQQAPAAALSQFQCAPASWQCQGGSVLEVAAVPAPVVPAVQAPAVQVPAGPALGLAPAAGHTWGRAAPAIAAGAALAAGHHALKRGLNADAWVVDEQRSIGAKRQQRQQQATAEGAALWHSASLIQQLERERKQRQCMIAVLSTLPSQDVAQLLQARSFLAHF